jgi:hypothetical protein
MRCCCSGFTVIAFVSLLASLAFFSVSWILAYYAPQSSMSYFALVAVCSVECVFYIAYFVSVLRLRSITPSWNAHRMMLPLFDLFACLVAGVVSSWMLPCGVLLDLYDQLHLLGTPQAVAVCIVLASLAVKLCTCGLLTYFHIRWAKRMSRERPIDPHYYVELSPMSPAVLSSPIHRPCNCPACVAY